MDGSYSRDRRTWLSYLVLLHYAYFLVCLGAVLPYLRRELHFGYGVASMHLSAFGVGTLLSALAARRVERARGRLWLTAAGVIGPSAGAVLLTIGRSPVATVACAFAMGAIGGWAIVGAQAALADRHPHHRATALTEGHVGGSLGAFLLPVAVGLAQAVVGWRAALVGGAVAGAGIVMALRAIGVHGAPVAEEGEIVPAPPRHLRLVLVALFMLVSTEGCLTFWGATFMNDEVGLSTRSAVACTSVFFAAGLTGRVIMSALSRRFAAGRLLAGALALAIAAFPLLWLATGAPMAIAGLTLMGLGIGAFWPLTVSIAVASQPRAATLINARTVMTGATSGIIAPMVLGPLGDAAGLSAAFALIPVALAVAVGMLLAFHRIERLA
jgi:MFS family permease